MSDEHDSWFMDAFGVDLSQVVQPVVTDLPKKAKVTSLGITKAKYDFGRPITREQAVQVLFVDGKVPAGAELLPGPDANSWILRAPDLDTWQAMLGRMRARTQTVKQGRPNSSGGTWNPPEPDEISEEWSDTPSPPRTGPERRDLKNDLGFRIAKHYALDEGKSPVKHVKSGLGLGKGHGYELVFVQPVTKAQVMDTLFGKNDLGEGTVYLKPDAKEPATTWQVHVIGVDALGAFQRPVFRAIADANVYAGESIAPDLPKGIRAHIEKKTVPPNATKHPSNVHVWEQEGFIVRVETDGKGGYYQYETTALTKSDEASDITIRYFMIEQGLKSREAWQEYIKHWDEIHRMIITGLAMALSSGRLFGKAPPIAGPRVRMPSARRPKVNVDVPEPPPPKVNAGVPAPAAPRVGSTAGQPGKPVLPNLTQKEIDASFAGAQSGTPVRMPGKNPRTGEGLSGEPKIKFDPDKPIAHHDNMKFKGIKDAPAGKVEVRRHSANKNAPQGSYSRDNPTTQINSGKKYRLPDGSYKEIGDMTDAEKAAAHIK